MRKTVRLFTLLLIFALMLSLVSCEKYKPVSSSKEEKATVFTVNGKYEAPYELYRFVFLNTLRAQGNAEGWDEAKRAEVFSVCDAAARKEIARVYTVLSLCDEYGVDPYGKEIDKKVSASVTEAIDAEEIGYETKDNYLKALYESYMTDSVFRFYLRLNFAEEMLAKAMQLASFVSEDADTVKAYFKSESTVRATWIYVPYGSAAYENFTKEMLDELVKNAKEASDADFVATAQQYLQTLYMPDELAEGFYFGKYQLDSYFEKLTETAFALSEGETSDLIHSGDGVYVVRRLPKDEAYIDNAENLELLREYYLLDNFYRVISEKSEETLLTLKSEKAYERVTLDSVKMGK